MDNKKYSLGFVIIAVIFVTALVVSNIISVKLISIFGLVLPAGIIIFPISYIVGDILTEVYGFGHAKRVIFLGLLCNILVVFAIFVGQLLHPAVFWDGQTAYERILGYTPRLVLASFIAYFVGELSNSFVMSQLKSVTKNKHLWFRTITSTIVGQGLDSILFIVIAFAGNTPNNVLLTTIITQWIVKTLYEAIATPATYLIINTFVNYEQGKTDNT